MRNMTHLENVLSIILVQKDFSFSKYMLSKPQNSKNEWLGFKSKLCIIHKLFTRVLFLPFHEN